MTDINTEPETSVKKTPIKRTVAKKNAANNSAIINLENETAYHQMIQDAAYFIAEQHHFSGDPQSFWLEAEKQLSEMLKH